MSCFNDCVSLKEIELPSGLEIIEEYCFCNSGVQRVNFPRSLKEVENFAFYRCSRLFEVRLAQDSLLAKVAEHAFSGTPLEDAQSKFLEVAVQRTQSDSVAVNTQIGT